MSANLAFAAGVLLGYFGSRWRTSRLRKGALEIKQHGKGPLRNTDIDMLIDALNRIRPKEKA